MAVESEAWEGAWGRHVAIRRAVHRRAAEVGTSSQRRWHAARLMGLDERRWPWQLRVCGRARAPLRCGCDDLRTTQVGCGRRWLCPRCEARHGAKMARRVAESVRAHLSEAGAGARVYLVTLTLPHEPGDEAGGRIEERLDLAWRAMTRHRRPWSRGAPHLAVCEWTPGRDGAGHPHLHVVVVARWLNYRRLRSAWERAAAEIGARRPEGYGGCDVTSRSGGASRCGGRPDCGCAACAAARYVAAYVTSTSRQRYTVEEWARLLAFYTGRRTVRASRTWWRDAPPACRECGQRHVRVTVLEERWRLAGGRPGAAWEIYGLGGERDPLQECRGIPPPPVVESPTKERVTWGATFELTPLRQRELDATIATYRATREKKGRDT